MQTPGQSVYLARLKSAGSGVRSIRYVTLCYIANAVDVPLRFDRATFCRVTNEDARFLRASGSICRLRPMRSKTPRFAAALTYIVQYTIYAQWLDIRTATDYEID